MADFYSQAFNFPSALQSGVDPRTGLYSVSLPIARLIGNANLGPSLDLALRYDPLGAVAPGIGQGFSLGLSRYDSGQRLLILSTGDQFKVNETTNGVSLQQNRLDTVRFEKLTTGSYAGYYKITHKSGEVELLRNDAFTIKVPSRIYSPTGRRLDLTWDQSGTTRRLTEVRDETTVLFQASYGTSVSTLTVWPGQTGSYTLRLFFQGNFLNRVENTSQTPALAWGLTYNPVGGRQMLTELQSPTGLIERVTYLAGTAAFPSGAGLPALPRVDSYTQYPQGNQPAISRTYTYSSNNYLGASASGGRWSPDSDYLYDVLTSYTYWSRETSVCGDRTMTIERTYNNFHLMTREVVSQGTAARTTETVYYARIGTQFKDQPPQFQLPRSSTVTYARNGGQSSRTETTTTEFDSAGNMTLQVTPDGTTTSWIYYPAGGEAGKCPPDPNGFVRFPKTCTVTPPATAYDAPVETTSYSYDALGVVSGSPVASAVMKTGEDLSRNGRLLHSATYAYVTDTRSAEFGRMSRLTETIHVPGGTPASYTRQTDFAFARQGGDLVQTATITTHDGLTVTRRRVQTTYGARLISETDPWGIETRYSYDGIGRILTSTTSAGTAFETVQSYAYELQSGSQKTSATIVTDPRGVRTRYWTDALGREVRREMADADGALQGWITIASRSYDAWGRVTEATDLDVLRADGGGSQTTVSGTTRFAYDDWGGNDVTTLPDGHQERSAYDPVSLQTQTGLIGPGQGWQVTTCNLLGLPTTTTRHAPDGTVLATITCAYDGIGRLRRRTDELGQVTAYSYDDWDRVIATTLPDGTAVTKNYAPDSNDTLITAVRVGSTSLGLQTFDGLGRKQQTTTGGQTTSFTYEGNRPVPASEHRPDGVTASFTWEPALGFSRTQISAGGMVQSYVYAPAGILLTNATQTGGAVRDIAYYPSGLLKSETTRTAPDAPTRSTSYLHSLQGRLQHWTDIGGTTQRFAYDGIGRNTGITDPGLTASISYDGFGRPSSWTATDPTTGRSLTTTLGYDAFGLEISREISGAASLSMSQSWRPNGQIQNRTTREGGTVLRQENFGYDSRNRLTSYSCAGSQPPVDGSGRAISALALSYDALGNVVGCTTTLTDGTDTAVFTYDTTDPSRLVRVTHTHPGYPARIDLAYDGAGRMILDGAGRRLGYDPLGRLITVDGGTTASYGYDATDRLILQGLNGGGNDELHYRGSLLANQIETGSTLRFPSLAGLALGQRRDGTGAATALYGTDGKGSVLLAAGIGSFAYTPYGFRPVSKSVPNGFDAERQDPATGMIHLGNGYRAYDPVLMRFTTPDSWSPFGPGGINRYAYCAGDPINLADPTGHLSVSAWIGIGLGILGIIATVVTFGMAAAPVIAAEGVIAGISAGASAVGVIGGLGLAADITGIVSGALEEAAPQASAILGWVSMGLGAPGAMEGLAKLGSTVGRRVGNSLSELSERVATIQREGLSGRGAPRAARAWAAEAPAARRPWEAASEGRSLVTSESGVVAPRSRFDNGAPAQLGRGETARASNYPHLSPAANDVGRAAVGIDTADHVTSTRYVTTTIGDWNPSQGMRERFDVVQRFRQDNQIGAQPLHDRFFAADNQGRLYNVTATSPSGRVEVPSRGTPLTETNADRLTFTVGAPTGDPPLSPRSIRRRVPDTGYR
ncbi:RHS repeat-associated core domain-containing protein [Tistrella mobilis]|uniref:RHS repeat-associated core domain-containing protein n=1 Tax=Tistrella mobilis TaxID=171437 RepID=UPI0035571BBD